MATSSGTRFTELAKMTVEGVGISAIARIKGYAWNTVARWRHLAALFAIGFTEKMLKGFEVKELQGDEIRTFVNTRKKPVWIFTMLEVWSRLWVSCVIGRRSYRNVKKDRVVHVDRNLVVGTRNQLEETLFNSEDSSTINTSFI